MKKSMNINFVLSNRVAYTLITFLILTIVGVGVYAVAGTIPDPGHSITKLQPCSDGEILKSSGGVWSCVDGSAAETDPTVLNFAQNGISTCGAGSSIRVINNDGTVTCETDTNTQRSTKTRVYKIHTGCSDPNKLTVSSTCLTKTCGADNRQYYSCNSACVKSQTQTCSNIFAGNLVN